MRIREELIFLTLFNISSKTQLSLDNFATIATLCLIGAAESKNRMTLALWTKIGIDYCKLKDHEVTMLYKLFESSLACGLKGSFPNIPTVHRFITFLFCVIFRHAILSKKSTMATDDAWPLHLNGEDLDASIRSYFPLNINVLIASLCLTPDKVDTVTINAGGLTLIKEAVEGLDILFQVESSSQDDFVGTFCSHFSCALGDPVLKVTTSISQFLNTTVYDCANVIPSSMSDPIRSYSSQMSTPNVLINSASISTPVLDGKSSVSSSASPMLAATTSRSQSSSLTSSTTGQNCYEYDNDHNHIRVRNLSRAGMGIFASPSHAPPSAFIANCTNCTIFLIVPCSHVVIANCRNVKIVLGTVAGTISMSYCMRMTLSAIGAFFKATTVENCLIYLTSRYSCVHDGSIKTNKIAPYNYIFPCLDEYLEKQGLVDVCQQGESFGMKLYSPLGLGIREDLIFMDPKTYCTAMVPFDSKLLAGKTKTLPLILPSVFRQTMKERSEKLASLGTKIRDPSITAEQKAAFEAYCKSAFISWVKANVLTTELLEVTTAKMYELE